MLNYPLNDLRRFSNDEFRKLRTLIEETELDAKLRSDYSGRAMYGEQCISIYLGRSVTESALLATLLEGLIEEAIQFAHDEGANYEYAGSDDPKNEAQLMIAKILFMMKQARTDSMGIGSIVYFPGITAEDNGAPDDEEGDDGE
jgi:hypothetical protein